ncbi:MAG: ECF transporter S component [Inconstantimicrobium porci]|uniref:ECF transporter S component n=1 Tax=Inconstantimicrobium porci TaxID=2652291 RepID=UPI002A91A35F|nr:ECF transporter S component [Inconstantimicrobium porci]MDY5913402.1 ECF transporter S component [Inconstantimicrobium porci]
MRIENKTKWLTFTALFLAMNVVLSSFSIPVPGGHLYLNDVIICTASIMMDPFSAFLVGGVGAFLGDFLFYPAPMFVSLVTHGIQAVVISLIANKWMKNKEPLGAIVGVTVGAVIMVVGYTLGRTFVYANWQTAVVKFPFECLQAGVGAIGGVLLCYTANIKKRFTEIVA